MNHNAGSGAPRVVLAAGALLALCVASAVAPAVYRLVVKRLAVRQFGRLNQGEVGPIIASMKPDVHHYFPGDHALGGERTSKAAVERWFGRVLRLFPGMRFEVERVAVGGPPWNTVAAVEWKAGAPLADGSTYENRGAHVIRLSFGRVVSFHAHMDSQKTADALERLARHGLEEAKAPQILD